MEFASVLIAGLAIGSVYALVALSVNIVYSARRIVNFAQGDLVMLAGLVGAVVIVSWGVPYVLGLVAVSAVIIVLALVIERLAVRPLSTDDSSIAWILSIVAVAIVLSNAMVLIFGTDARQFPSLISNRPVDVGALRIVPDHLTAIFGTMVFLVILHLAQTRTLHGKAMRAAARDPEMAAMLGIPVRWYIAGAFGLSGVMAAIAAFLVGPMTFVSAHLGFALGIKGFAAAAMGGLGSFGGAVIGGLLLGLAETLSAAYIGSAAKDSVSLAILCVILIVRPTGLLGEPRVTKL